MPDARNIPLDALLTRKQVAEALTELGFGITNQSLETMAVRGNGPPYSRWGAGAVRYRWQEALNWAHGRLSNPHTSTAAHRLATVKAPAA
jgi:hypothetical protein